MLDEDGGRKCPTCSGSGDPQPPVECEHRKMEYRREVGGYRFVEPLYHSDTLTCIDCRAPMVVLPADVVADCRAAVAAGGLLAAAIIAHVNEAKHSVATPFPLGDFITKNAELLALLPKEVNDDN